MSKSCSNSVSGAALLLGVTPETIDSWLSEKDRISQLEKEVKDLQMQIKFQREMTFKLKSEINNTIEKYAQ